jgi:ankyrin repeat protein
MILSGLLVMAAAAQSQEVFDLLRKGDVAAVKALVEKSPQVLELRDGNGRTLLHYAAIGGSAEFINYLVDKGAKLEFQDAQLKTPLHLAAMNDRQSALAALLKRGAAIEARDDYQRTALILCARERGQAPTGRVLIEAGADVNAVDKFGDDALSLAAWRGKREFVDLLLEKGAKVPDGGEKWRERITQAASQGLTKLFQRLVAQGQDLKSADPTGVSLLPAAAAGGSDEIIGLLITQGFDVTRPDRYGWTPLHYAARDGRIDAARLLIEKGAPLNARTIMGQTAYNVAQERKMAAVATLLTEKGADTSAMRFPVLKGNYLGQRPPGEKAELFALGVISSIWGLHSTAVFSPDGNEVFWNPMIDYPGEVYSRGGLMMMKRANGRWAAPDWAPFSGPNSVDGAPFFSPNGTRMYFPSRRPLPGETKDGGSNIWFVDRTASGWSEPRPLDVNGNAIHSHWQLSMDREGNIYFDADGISEARFVSEKYERPVKLGRPISTETGGETSPFIAPDGSFLLFSREFDLWVSFRGDGGAWSDPVKLGPEVNSPAMELCPRVTADGKYLFFLSNRDGINHVYWVRAGVIEKARSGRALTSKDVVARCARAMGGEAAIKGLKTMRVHSIYPDHGSEPIPFEIMRPNLSRNPHGELVFDGTRACSLKGMDGKSGPQMVDAEDLKDFEVEIGYYFPAFFDRPSEYLGIEKRRGNENHKLLVALPLGAEMTYYIDTQTNLVSSVVSEFSIGGKDFRFERVYSDYRTIGGFTFPYGFTYDSRNGVMSGRVDKIEFNVPLDKRIFQIPTQTK